MQWLRKLLNIKLQRALDFSDVQDDWVNLDISVEEARTQAQFKLQTALYIKKIAKPCDDTTVLNLLPPCLQEVFHVYERIEFEANDYWLERPSQENVFKIGNRTFIGIGVMNNLYVEANQETVYDVEYPLYETDAPEVIEDFLHLLDSGDFQYSSVYIG